MTKLSWTSWAALAAAAILAGVAARGAEPVQVTVQGDRVNLRAQPKLEAEVAGQVNDGETLTVRGAEGEWVEVEPPSRVDVWVHRDFVRDGVVQVSNLQVRAGPGINYSRVGMVNKGDKVEVRGEFGEWLKIAPPPGTTLWVSRPYVRFPTPPSPPPEPPKVVATSPTPPTPPPKPPAVETSRPIVLPKPPEPPPEFRLAPTPHQGRVVQREGYIQPIGYLFKRPSRFLLATESNGRMETVCYLWGNDEQLDGLRGRRLTIEGREYWLQGLRHPMLVVERIRLISP